MPGFNPHKFRAKQIAITDSDDDSTGSDIDQPADPAPICTEAEGEPPKASMPVDTTKMDESNAPSAKDEAPAPAPSAAPEAAVVEVGAAAASEEAADPASVAPGMPEQHVEVCDPASASAADATAGDSDPAQCRQDTMAPDEIGECGDVPPEANDEDCGSSAVNSAVDLAPAYSMAAAPCGRGGWTMTESAVDGPADTAEPAPGDATSVSDVEEDPDRQNADGPSSPPAEPSVPQQAADAVAADTTPAPKEPETVCARGSEPGPESRDGASHDGKEPPSGSVSTVDDGVLPPPVTVPPSASRRSSAASARGTGRGTGGVFSRLYNPSILEQRRLVAKQRVEQRERDELARTAENLTFQPKLRENPFVQVHSRYHYGQPLEAHDPKWLKKRLQEQEARVQRDGF